MLQLWTSLYSFGVLFVQPEQAKGLKKEIKQASVPCLA